MADQDGLPKEADESRIEIKETQPRVVFLSEEADHVQKGQREPRFTFSHISAWFRLLGKVGKLDLLPFVFQSRLNPEVMRQLQDLLNQADFEQSIRSGTDIYKGDRDKLSRIYDAALASKAVYTLSEHIFDEADPNAVQALKLLGNRYEVDVHNFSDFALWLEHPRDSVLLKPKAAAKNAHYVFAVKGTATAQDWVDNLDTDPKFDYHAALTKEGRLMTEEMRETLKELLVAGQRVVFTGHSSGGAVASFLYTQLYEPKYNMDCIVFGSAANSRPEIVESKPGMDKTESNKDTDKDNQNSNVRIAFCNRSDPVPRATYQYLEWFLDTWKDYHHAVKHNDKSFTVTAPPKNVLVPFGQIVILKMDDKPSTEGGASVTAGWLTSDNFYKLVYLDPLQHPMDRYLRSVLSLLKQSGYGSNIDELLKAVS